MISLALTIALGIILVPLILSGIGIVLAIIGGLFSLIFKKEFWICVGLLIVITWISNL